MTDLRDRPPVLDIVIPPFYCPVPPAVHPDLATFRAGSADWIDRMGLTATAHERERLLGTDSALFFSRLVPAGLPERMQIAVDWCYWGFGFDDLYCDGEGHDPMPALVRRAARALRVAETLDVRLCGDDPYLRALHDIATRFHACATPVQLWRWVQSLRQWLFGVVHAAANRSDGLRPDLDEYVTARLTDCGGAPTTAMVEIAGGGEVPGPLMDSPAVRACTEACWLVAAWDNERVSHIKERLLGEDPHNTLVSALGRTGRITEDEAGRRAVALRDRVLGQFLRLRARLADVDEPNLARYLGDLAQGLRGNVDWSLETLRYRIARKVGEIAPTVTVSIAADCTDTPTDNDRTAPDLPSIAWWWNPDGPTHDDHRRG